MKNIIRSIILAVTLIPSTMVSASLLTPDDFCDVSLNTPVRIKEMRPMSDGETYAAISSDGRSIETFSYKTGKKVATLFSVDNVKGDVRIQEFDGYEISANEKKILLWNDIRKIYRNSFTAEYYLYDIMRGTMKKISNGGPQRVATVSHDGRKVAFVRDNNIIISNLEYETERAVTVDGEINSIIYGAPDWCYEEEFGIDNTIRWSADDNTLVYMRFDETDVPTYSFDIYSGYCNPQPEYDLYPEEYRYKYPLAGFNNSVVSVEAYNLDNRTIKKMDIPMDSSDYIPSLEFAADGVTLMAMTLNRDQNKLSLFAVNTASTVARQIYTDKSENAWLSPSAYQMVEYENDGFIIGSERSGYRHLYMYDYSGNLKKQLTNGDFNITAYYGRNSVTGQRYFQCTVRGAQNRNIASIGVDGKMSVLNNVDGFESGSFSKDCRYYVRTYSNVDTPTQFTLHSSNGKLIAELEMNIEYAHKYNNAPRKELLFVPNAEGQEMNAFIIKPSDFDPSKKYPLLMYQYNGPDSQEVLNTWRIDGINYIAECGYIVACVDGRGTGNRTRKWANVVYKQLGRYETEDQLAGAAYFGNLSYVDSSRMACFGWSYGGYMTLMELTAPGSPFKAGVSMAPVTDWRFYDSVYTERYMLTPSQNEDGYTLSSALERTGMLDAKLLIMSGTSDDNVHFYNTLRYTSKLTSEGKIFDMMAYTGFDHSLRMCNARVQLYRKIVDFLDTRLK